MNRTSKPVRMLVIGIGCAAALTVGAACRHQDSASQAATCSDPGVIRDYTLDNALTKSPPPEGVQLVGARIHDPERLSGLPRMIGVDITVCAPSIRSADELRPIATHYARAVKGWELAYLVQRVRVDNFWMVGDEVAEGGSLLEVENFHQIPWNSNTPESTVPANADDQHWEVVPG